MEDRGKKRLRVKNMVDELLENAYLRASLSDLGDDSLELCDVARWTLAEENVYLSEILDWECSPIVTVRELLPDDVAIPDVKTATDAEISVALKEITGRLQKFGLVFRYADHLSDRSLCEIIIKKVLPSRIKRLSRLRGPVVWNFCFYDENNLAAPLDADDVNWLTYYATDAERNEWSRRRGRPAPPKQPCKWRREDLAEHPAR